MLSAGAVPVRVRPAPAGGESARPPRGPEASHLREGQRQCLDHLAGTVGTSTTQLARATRRLDTFVVSTKAVTLRTRHRGRAALMRRRFSSALWAGHRAPSPSVARPELVGTPAGCCPCLPATDTIGSSP